MIKILRNFLRSVLDNLKYIITSLIVSIIIWFAISLQIFPDIYANISNIPVQVIPTQYMISQNLKVDIAQNFTTSVQVQGKRYDIGSLSVSDFEAHLDLSSITDKGLYEVDIIITPIDSSKCTVIPDERKLYVGVKRILTKTLDVAVSADNIKVVEGLQIDTENLSSNPSTVTLTGEQDLIDSVAKAEIMTSYEGEMLATTEVKGELVLYNKDNAIIDNADINIDNTYFTATVPIHKLKTLPLEFTITGCPSNFDINGLLSKMTITPGELIISSPNNSIDTLEKLNVGSIALNDLNYKMLVSPYRDTIAKSLADGYKNISGNASFSLEFADMDDYVSYPVTLSSDNFMIYNAPSNYEVNILTKELTVTVVGPSSFVQALNVDDIAIYINLMGMEMSEGSKTVNTSYKINGVNVPAWIVDYPQVNVLFTEKTIDE